MTISVYSWSLDQGVSSLFHLLVIPSSFWIQVRFNSWEMASQVIFFPKSLRFSKCQELRLSQSSKMRLLISENPRAKWHKRAPARFPQWHGSVCLPVGVRLRAEFLEAKSCLHEFAAFSQLSKEVTSLKWWLCELVAWLGSELWHAWSNFKWSGVWIFLSTDDTWWYWVLRHYQIPVTELQSVRNGRQIPIDPAWKLNFFCRISDFIPSFPKSSPRTLPRSLWPHSSFWFRCGQRSHGGLACTELKSQWDVKM